MKTTWYSENDVKFRRPEARREDWIERVLRVPIAKEVEINGRIRYWGYIREARKYLRVVVLEDNETVHKAFFDRDFRPKRRR